MRTCTILCHPQKLVGPAKDLSAPPHTIVFWELKTQQVVFY
jgi:hypothetical protein